MNEIKDFFDRQTWTLAQEYANRIGLRFRDGLPAGVPAPRTADSLDPSVETMDLEKNS